ncbi:hypothetical protein EIP86_002047 [Pleurotus ostreatoroseus]|nr:hypothetical protein EIP86_002047 [Pleurotus ostreatoroseus]
MSNSQDPWHLTVVRTHGVLFLRPEKSWRPIVTITLEDSVHMPYELMLGCDGQNPNLKMPFVLNDVDESSRLDIKLWHKSHRKSRRKQHMVGTAYVTLGELLKRREMSGQDIPISLRCPPPQKRSIKLRSTRQSNTATLTVRIRTPYALLARSFTTSSDSVTLAPSPAPSVCDGREDYSDDEDCTFVVDEPPEGEILLPDPSKGLKDSNKSSLRRRKYIKPYCVNTSDEEDVSVYCSSSDEGPACVSVSSVHEEGIEESCGSGRLLPFLPQHVHHEETQSGGISLSLLERAIDRFAPYREMLDPGCDFGLVQRRLMAEWYAVAGALLGVAALNAAVFGYSSSDTVFEIDSLALRSVLFGSIVGATGLVVDIWFLVLFGGADPEKFERVSRDVYGSHFFFCLKCRFPTLCLFLSVCALMLFLLAVAWTAWPTAVLVLCCLAGTLLTLQYLVFGFHRAVNFGIWLAQRAWRGIARKVWSNAGEPMELETRAEQPVSVDLRRPSDVRGDGERANDVKSPT